MLHKSSNCCGCLAIDWMIDWLKEWLTATDWLIDLYKGSEHGLAWFVFSAIYNCEESLNLIIGDNAESVLRTRWCLGYCQLYAVVIWCFKDLWELLFKNLEMVIYYIWNFSNTPAEFDPLRVVIQFMKGMFSELVHRSPIMHSNVCVTGIYVMPRSMRCQNGIKCPFTIGNSLSVIKKCELKFLC